MADSQFPSGQPVVNEAALSLTDITTANSSTSKHGLLPKLDGNAAHYLDGTGAFSSAGGGGTPSGVDVVPPALYLSADSSYNNFTLVGKIHGGLITITAASWKFTMVFTAGTGVHVQGCTVLRTLRDSATVIDSTPVTFNGGSSTPYTLVFGFTANRQHYAILESDAIALALDTTHDYYLMLYLDNDGTYNGSVGVPASAAYGSGIVGGYISGDQTAASTVPTGGFGDEGTGYVCVKTA